MYYDLVNRQSFMTSQGEARLLREWFPVFTSCLTEIFNDREFLELLVFKLPWFLPTTTHGQSFHLYMRLLMAMLPRDISFIHNVINHFFS